MKKLLLFLVCLVSSAYALCDAFPLSSDTPPFTLTASAPKRSNVCLNMIVKNEAHVICRCLESVKPLIDSWVIVDTGSTDGTQEIIKEFLSDIPGQLHERPWINFAHNRNEALELARGTADYLLFMDADDILTYDDPNYVRPALLDKDGYYMHIDYSGTAYDRVQLINTHCPWKWIGVVHEVIFSDEIKSMEYLKNVTMTIIGGGGRSQNPDKYLIDARMLEEDLLRDPNNARTVFYLAQSYRDGNLFEKSIDTYEQRVAMGGWDEEVFWSLYQIALLKERLNYDAEEVIASYFRAFDNRPSRVEPLYRVIAYHNRQGKIYHAYLLAQLALKIPKPNDLIFVESWIYDAGLLFEYALCVSALGQFQEALNVHLSILANPKTPQHVRKATESHLSSLMMFINKNQSISAAEQKAG